MNPVRDVTATTACPVCGTGFEPEGRQRFCSTGCRQTAWRHARHAPIEPVVARVDTIYACPDCDVRYLGQQRCDDCNTWCRRLGPGGTLPMLRRTSCRKRPLCRRPARHHLIAIERQKKKEVINPY